MVATVVAAVVDGRDLEVVQDKVARANLGVAPVAGGVQTDPGLAALGARDLHLDVGGRLHAVLERDGQELGGHRVAGLVSDVTVAHDHLVARGGRAGLVVKLDDVLLAGLEQDVLRRGLVQQALAAVVVLERPVAVNRVVDLLVFPTGLRKLAVALREVRHRVAAVGGGADHERIQAGHRVLKVLRVVALLVLDRELVVLDKADVVHVGRALAGSTADGEVGGLGVRRELHVHTRHVGIAQAARLTLVAGGVVLGQRARHGAGRLVLTGRNRNRRLGIALVGDVELGHIGLARLHAAELRGHRNVLGRVGDGEALVAGGGMLHRHRSILDVAGPGLGFELLALGIRVEARVDHAGALAKVHLVGGLGGGIRLDDDVGGLGLRVDRHGAAGNVLDLLAALVGELVEHAAVELSREVPRGGAAVDVVVVELLLAILLPRQQVGTVLEHLRAVEGDHALADGVIALLSLARHHDLVTGLVGENNLLLVVGNRRLVALGAGVDVPIDNLVMLQEARGEVIGERGVDVGVEVVLVAPALKAFLVPAAQQRVVHHAALGGGVVGRDVALVVAQEAHDVGVDALERVAAVLDLGRPVAPRGVVLALVGELGGEAPTERVDLLSDAAGLPCILVPHVEVDEVHVVVARGGVLAELVQRGGGGARHRGIADVLALLEVLVGKARAVDAVVELHKAVPAGVGAQIPQLVDDGGLVHPAPAGTLALNHALVERLGLGVRLLGVHVNADLGVVLMGDLDQIAEALSAALFGGDVGVLGVGGIVALVAVALQQQRLGQAVGDQRDLLDVVGGQRVGVGHLGAKVHDDAVGHQVLDGLGAVRHVQARADGVGAVVPVDDPVVVGIALGDGDLHPRQLARGQLHVVVGGDVLLRLGVAVLVVPHGAGKAHGVQAAVQRDALVLLLLGVGEDAGRQVLVAQDAVHEALLAVRVEGAVEAVEGIAGKCHVGGHLGTREALAAIDHVEGQQVHAGQVDRLERGAVVRLLDLGHLPGKGGALDLELDGHVRVDGHALDGIDVKHVGRGVARELARHLGRDLLAVDLELGQVALLAAEERARQVALQLVANRLRERLGDVDLHLVGLDGLVLGEVDLGLLLKLEVKNVGLVAEVLNVDLLVDGLVAGSHDGGALGANLDLVHQVGALFVGLGRNRADADGRTGNRGARDIRHDAANGGEVDVAHAHLLALALSGPAPGVLHDILPADGGIGELEGRLAVDLDAHHALAALLGDEVTHLLEGLLGLLTVDGDAHVLVAHVEGELELLTLDGLGQVAVERRVLARAVDLPLAIPAAALVIADVDPVVVVHIGVEHAEVDIVRHRDDGKIDRLGGLDLGGLIEQQRRSRRVGVSVLMTAAVVLAAGDLDPLAAERDLLGGVPALALHLVAIKRPLGKVVHRGFAHLDVAEGDVGDGVAERTGAHADLALLLHHGGKIRARDRGLLVIDGHVDALALVRDGDRGGLALADVGQAGEAGVAGRAVVLPLDEPVIARVVPDVGPVVVVNVLRDNACARLGGLARQGKLDAHGLVALSGVAQDEGLRLVAAKVAVSVTGTGNQMAHGLLGHRRCSHCRTRRPQQRPCRRNDDKQRCKQAF